MTFDASWSCLGLGTSVGSMTRLLVDARVLLTVTTSPTLPVNRMAGCSSAPPLVEDHRGLSLDRGNLPRDCPDEACQLAGNRRRHHIRRLSGERELTVASAQPELGFPGNVADRLRQGFLAQTLLATDAGLEAVGACRLV